MSDIIRIQMMGNFTVYINERQADHMMNKSRKGLALMQYLIMNREQPVSNQRLLATFWPDERVSNPENALKTLISRMRTLLNQVSEDMGRCIVSDRGAYHWECLPGMTVDVYELESVLSQLAREKTDEEAQHALYQKMMKLYAGDLLKNSELNEWVVPQTTTLHNQYLAAVLSYVELLKRNGDDEEIIIVCRKALEIDPFDEKIHIQLMSALLRGNQTGMAKTQYDEVLHLYHHYLNVEPSKELMEFYKEIVSADKNLEFNLESICNELREDTGEHGAFVCEYPVFKEIFNIQMRNIERLGSTIFLAIVMVSKINGQPMDSVKQARIMQGLVDILKCNLRKGDAVTHFSPTMIAVLLPTVNYTTGDTVMERMKFLFYRKYPNSNVLFNYRIAPLSAERKKKAGE